MIFYDDIVALFCKNYNIKPYLKNKNKHTSNIFQKID